MHLNLSDPRLIVGVAVIVLLIVVGIALNVRKRRKTSARLRRRFGAEYDRAVLEHGSERNAEVKLPDREMRVENLKIRKSWRYRAGTLCGRVAIGAIPFRRSSKECGHRSR
jgi:hypothetical protein